MLDNAACSGILRYARFHAARDKDNDRVVDTVTMPVSFRLD